MVTLVCVLCQDAAVFECDGLRSAACQEPTQVEPSAATQQHFHSIQTHRPVRWHAC